MKRFLIILLIVCILVVATDIVLAKVSFGGWDKWDESLPPWDNKNWKEKTSTFVSFPPLKGSMFWFWSGEKWRVLLVGRSLSAGNEDVFLLLTRLSFIDKKVEASIILFSPAQSKETKGIKDNLTIAEIALVTFPPKKRRSSCQSLREEEWIVFVLGRMDCSIQK
jgi:hypothetical protein